MVTSQTSGEGCLPKRNPGKVSKILCQPSYTFMCHMCKDRASIWHACLSMFTSSTDSEYIGFSYTLLSCSIVYTITEVFTVHLKGSILNNYSISDNYSGGS